jgi:flagellar motor switch protein FliN
MPDKAPDTSPGVSSDPIANAGATASSPPDSSAVAAASAATPDAAALVSEVTAAVAKADAPPAADAAPQSASTGDAAVDELLRQAQFEDPVAGTELPPELESLAAAAASKAAMGDAAAAGPAVGIDAKAMDMPNFSQVIRDAQTSSIDLLRDVELNVKIELGRSRMLVEDVLKLGEGSVVELDKLAGDPVDVFVNDRLVARGEVLVLNDNFCVRVNEIVAANVDDLT